jgi:hypothetical protein
MGLMGRNPRVANAPAFLPGAIICRPSGALFWRWREGFGFSERWEEI